MPRATLLTVHIELIPVTAALQAGSVAPSCRQDTVLRGRKHSQVHSEWQNQMQGPENPGSAHTCEGLPQPAPPLLCWYEEQLR